MTVAIERESRVQPVVLEGRHVRLEPLALDHARALLAAASGPRDTYGFTTVPPDEPSMLRYIEDEQLPQRVTLIYSNRDRASAAFLDELEEIERANPNVRLIVTMTEDEHWSGERRRIDADFVRDRLGDDLNSASYMVAGPPGMAEMTTGYPRRRGFARTTPMPGVFNGS